MLAQKVTTEDELDKAMKKVQSAMQATLKAIKSGSYEEARSQLAIVKQVTEDELEFWILHKKNDAIDANKAVLAHVDAADKLLAATPVDSAAVGAAMKDVGGACLACHKTYRVRDAEKNWVLKPGSIGN
jgi:cytochrome c556